MTLSLLRRELGRGRKGLGRSCRPPTLAWQLPLLPWMPSRLSWQTPMQVSSSIDWLGPMALMSPPNPLPKHSHGLTTTCLTLKSVVWVGFIDSLYCKQFSSLWIVFVLFLFCMAGDGGCCHQEAMPACSIQVTTVSTLELSCELLSTTKQLSIPASWHSAAWSNCHTHCEAATMHLCAPKKVAVASPALSSSPGLNNDCRLQRWRGHSRHSVQPARAAARLKSS